MNWRHETWRKLYIREEGSFAVLPFYTRMVAAYLLKLCDTSGRVFARGREPVWQAVGMRVGADTGERRRIKQAIEELLEDGYLVAGRGFVRIRNFQHVHAMDGRVPETTAELDTALDHEKDETNLDATLNGRIVPTDRELPTKSKRTDNELPANCPRTSDEIQLKLAESFNSPSGVPSLPSKERAPAVGERRKGFDSVVATFCAIWKEAKGRDYYVTGADRKNFGALLQTLSPAQVADLPAQFRAYLRDQGSFVIGKGHSLNWFATGGNGVNAYHPAPPAQPRQRSLMDQPTFDGKYER